VRLASVVVGIVASAQDASARPHNGKVVRVERASRVYSGIPRFCLVQSEPPGQVSGQCFGVAPLAGDVMTVLDDSQVVATVQIANVTAATDPSCSDSGIWVVTGSPISGQQKFQDSKAVIDIPLDPRVARIVHDDRSPTGHSTGVDSMTIAVDSNGDGATDYELVAFACDAAGVPVTTTVTGTCLEWYAVGRHGFERVRQDRMRICY
jgi:hypothetical protein